MPTMSIASGATVRTVASACIASTMPVSSSIVSPFMRMATMKAAIWLSAARPASISASTIWVCAAVRSWPAWRVPRMVAHPPAVSNSVVMAPSL